VHEGKPVLFVGTKKQAQQAIEREAKRCGMYYVNNRWLGGMLTNFSTIKRSILRLKKLEKMEVDGTFESLTKKEVARLLKEKARLEKNLGGIKEMKELPGALFVIDTRKEAIAIAEARRMGIPIVAVVDTNCDPTGIDYPIPGNDDAIRAITLFTSIISKAVIEADNEIGLEVIENLQDEDEEDGVSGDGTEEGSDEEVETVSLGAAVGADEEEAAETEESFTAEDYSDYEPGEDPELPKDEQTPEEAVAKEAGLDEETLYQE
jgi:small subunit ribosomal protein S2